MPKTSKTKIISLEIPDYLRTALKLEAFNRDLSLSACIRELLIEKLGIDVPEQEQEDDKENN